MISASQDDQVISQGQRQGRAGHRRGYRGLRSLGGALLAVLLLAAAIAPQGAGAVSRLSITSFSADSTLPQGVPGRTTSVQPSCRRGFALLGTRFNVTATSANLSDPRNRPIVQVIGAVPTPNGVRLRFRNVGTGGALIRATADCARIGGSARSTRASEGAEAKAAKNKKEPQLKTYIVEETKKVKGGKAATAAGTESLQASCDRKNSIPSDLGFESKRSSFGGASFFERKGEIGIRAAFNTDGKDELGLYVVCQQGKRLELDGKVEGGKSARASASEPRAQAAAKKAKLPGLTVRYRQSTGTHHPDVPFPGAHTFADQTPRAFWMNPVPTSIPPNVLWIGRALRDPTPLQRAGRVPATPHLSPRGGRPTIAGGASYDNAFFPEDVVISNAPVVPPSDREAEFAEINELFRLKVEGERTHDAFPFGPIVDTAPIEPPPEPEPAPGGGSGPFGPVCDNDIDDDGDGKIDVNGGPGAPADPGCLSEQDTTEDEISKPFAVFGDSSGATNVYEFKPRGTTEPVEPASGYRVSFNPVLHDSNTVNHGGVPISGTSPCVQATPTTEIAAGVGDQAPTTSPTLGTPLGPPPDANHMRVVIDLLNPGSDPCPTATHTINIAVDTR